MSRRRYRWDEATQTMVEVGADYSTAEKRAPVATEGLVYGNLGRSTDGTQIDSRRKYAEYCKQHNVAPVQDFKETWAKDAQVRERISTGEYGRKERREAIGRAAYEVQKRGRK